MFALEQTPIMLLIQGINIENDDDNQRRVLTEFFFNYKNYIIRVKFIAFIHLELQRTMENEYVKKAIC